MNTVNITSSLSKARDLRQDLKQKYGADVGRCYQCGKCSAGCPVAFAMDNPPHKVIQMAKLGLYDELLKCRSTWLCATCHACSARCPREVNPSYIMEGLRIEARDSSNIGVRALDKFNTTFINLVEKHGRVHELALMLWYNVLTGRFLKDAQFGPEMILKKKLSIMPHTTAAARDEVQKIFARCRDYKEGKPIGSSFSDVVSSDVVSSNVASSGVSSNVASSGVSSNVASSGVSSDSLPAAGTAETSVSPCSADIPKLSKPPEPPVPSTSLEPATSAADEPLEALTSPPSSAPSPSLSVAQPESSKTPPVVESVKMSETPATPAAPAAPAAPAEVPAAPYEVPAAPYESSADSPSLLGRFAKTISNWLYEPDEPDQPSGGKKK